MGAISTIGQGARIDHVRQILANRFAANQSPVYAGNEGERAVVVSLTGAGEFVHNLKLLQHRDLGAARKVFADIAAKLRSAAGVVTGYQVAIILRLKSQFEAAAKTGDVFQLQSRPTVISQWPGEVDFDYYGDDLFHSSPLNNEYFQPTLLQYLDGIFIGEVIFERDGRTVDLRTLFQDIILTVARAAAD
jgi:hypothetical protein